MNFIGNQKVVSLLNRSLEGGAISHAYIFSGPEHLGKFTLARLFAINIIKRTRNLDKNVDADSTSLLDLLLLSPEIEEKKGIIKKRNIPVEKIRQVQTDLSLFPYHGEYKVLIIDDAHMMNIAAQNALLKTLEEPNKTSVLILITSEESRLLPTIKSRCLKINMTLVSEDEMRGHGNDEINFLSMGRPGLAKALTENPEILEFYKKSSQEILKIISAGVNDRMQMAEEFSKNMVKTNERMLLWMWILRNATRETNDAVTLSRNYDFIAKIEESMDILKTTNANARLVLENLFMQF